MCQSSFFFLLLVSKIFLSGTVNSMTIRHRGFDGQGTQSFSSPSFPYPPGYEPSRCVDHSSAWPPLSFDPETESSFPLHSPNNIQLTTDLTNLTLSNLETSDQVPCELIRRMRVRPTVNTRIALPPILLNKEGIYIFSFACKPRVIQTIYIRSRLPNTPDVPASYEAHLAGHPQSADGTADFEFVNQPRYVGAFFEFYYDPTQVCDMGLFRIGPDASVA